MMASPSDPASDTMNAKVVKLHGVYINPETRLSTMDVPHKKVSHGGHVYYIAQHPEGDFAIHEAHRTDKEGYGHSPVTFLMDDGSFETVIGPFDKQGPFDFGIAAKLAEAMGVPSVAVKATRITVGRNLHSYCAKGEREVVFEESEWQLTPVRDRLRQEWEGLELAVHVRGGTRYLKVGEVLEK